MKNPDHETIRRAADTLVESKIPFAEMEDVFKVAIMQSAVIKYGSFVRAAAALDVHRNTIYRILPHGAASE